MRTWGASAVGLRCFGGQRQERSEYLQLMDARVSRPFLPGMTSSTDVQRTGVTRRTSRARSTWHYGLLDELAVAKHVEVLRLVLLVGMQRILIDDTSVGCGKVSLSRYWLAPSTSSQKVLGRRRSRPGRPGTAVGLQAVGAAAVAPRASSQARDVFEHLEGAATTSDRAGRSRADAGRQGRVAMRLANGKGICVTATPASVASSGSARYFWRGGARRASCSDPIPRTPLCARRMAGKLDQLRDETGHLLRVRPSTLLDSRIAARRAKTRGPAPWRGGRGSAGPPALRASARRQSAHRGIAHHASRTGRLAHRAQRAVVAHHAHDSQQRGPAAGAGRHRAAPAPRARRAGQAA